MLEANDEEMTFTVMSSVITHFAEKQHSAHLLTDEQRSELKFMDHKLFQVQYNNALVVSVITKCDVASCSGEGHSQALSVSDVAGSSVGDVASTSAVVLENVQSDTVESEMEEAELI